VANPARAEALVQFKHLRWFIAIAFIANAIVFAAAFIVGNSFISYAIAVLTLGAVAYCVRCGTCGKSPFTWHRGVLRIGSPFPEAVCSKCGERIFR
jgi:hypothetical protein